MEGNPLISVLVPIYNSSRFLEDSIRSIINQTYSNFEIIIVDDSPTDDGSLAILQSLDDKRIKYIKPPERLGMVKSLNYAAQIAKGDYFARMDADDISHSKRFQLQVMYLVNNPNISVVGCNCYKIDENNKITGALVHPISDEEIKAKLLFNSAIIHPSVMMRKNVLLDNLYDENCFCCEDYELWSRLMSRYNFHNLSEKLFKYRILDNGMMQTQLNAVKNDDKYYQRHLSVMTKIYDHVMEYYGISGDSLHNNYQDLLFAKRINKYSYEERDQFLQSCKKIIETKCNNSEYIKKCIAYQWIKMTRKRFYKTDNKQMLYSSVKTMMCEGYEIVKVRLLGLLFYNRETFDWSI